MPMRHMPMRHMPMRHMPMRLVLLFLVVALGACDGATPAIVASAPAPVLPAAPAAFGRPVPLCKPRVGQDVRVFAACERAGHIRANRGLADDAAFYRDVVARFGAADAPKRTSASDAQ